jgi:hypothetical protein
LQAKGIDSNISYQRKDKHGEERKRQEGEQRMGLLYPGELGKSLGAVGKFRRKRRKWKAVTDVGCSLQEAPLKTLLSNDAVILYDRLLHLLARKTTADF